MSFLPFFSGKALSLLYSAAVFAFAINIPLSFHSYQNVSEQLETILATPIKESELMLAKILAMYPEQSSFLFILFFVKLIMIESQENPLIFVWELVLLFLLVISVQMLLMWCVLGIQVKRSLIVLNSSGKSMGSKITRFHLSLSVLSLMTLFGTTLMIVLCEESQYLFILGFTPIGWLSVLFYYLIAHRDFFPGLLVSSILISSFLSSEQQRRGGLLQGLTFVLSTIPFILIINATSRKKSPFFLLITLLSNFVATTFFITLLELYNLLSNVEEMIWIIKGVPNGVYRFLKVKN